MAATLPTDPNLQQESSTKKIPRKQWSSIQGGPRGLLRRMRSQLAEDGCPESQLVMGRTLLDQLQQEGNEGEGENEEGGRLAVYWLTQASLQGNHEATQLLTQCLNENIGICEYNYQEVKECLARDQQEKLARRAAHCLFHCLSDGNDVISSARLARKIEEIISGEEEQADQTESGTWTKKQTGLDDLYGGERFREEHVVSAAVLYSQGHLPPLHHYLPQPPKSVAATTATSSLCRAVVWPISLFGGAYDIWVSFLGRVVAAVAARYAVAAVALTICTLVAVLTLSGGLEALITVLPAAVTVLSLVTMVVATGRVLYDMRRLEGFHTWSKVWCYFNPDLDTQQAESRFVSGCGRPYTVAAMAAATHMVVSGTWECGSTWVWTVGGAVGWGCVWMTLTGVHPTPAPWIWPSAALLLAAATPGVPDWLEGHLGPLLAWPGAQVDLWGVQMAIEGPWPLLYLATSVIVVLSAISRPDQLRPHLLCLAWVYLAITHTSRAVKATPDALSGSSQHGPVLALCFGVFLGPALPPWAVMVAAPLLAAALAYHMALSWVYMAAVALTALAAVLLCQTWQRWFLPTVKLAFLSACVAVVALLIHSHHRHPQAATALTWEGYRRACVAAGGRGGDIATVVAMAEAGCGDLEGMVVRWRGTVSQVSVAEIHNRVRSALTLLPPSLARPLSCRLGQPLPSCPATPTMGEPERCQPIYSALGQYPCTLAKYDTYTYTIQLAMTHQYWNFGQGVPESEVTVSAGHYFHSFISSLANGDQVEFLAAISAPPRQFTATATSVFSRPHLNLLAVRCIVCREKMEFVSLY